MIIRINGHRIKCVSCKKHYAKTDHFGIYLCPSCFRAYSIGLLTGGLLQDIKEISKKKDDDKNDNH